MSTADEEPSGREDDLAKALRLKREAMKELGDALRANRLLQERLTALMQASSPATQSTPGEPDPEAVALWARLESYRERLALWEEALEAARSTQSQAEATLTRERQVLENRERALNDNRKLLESGIHRLREDRETLAREQGTANQAVAEAQLESQRHRQRSIELRAQVDELGRNLKAAQAGSAEGVAIDALLAKRERLTHEFQELEALLRKRQAERGIDDLRVSRAEHAARQDKERAALLETQVAGLRQSLKSALDRAERNQTVAATARLEADSRLESFARERLKGKKLSASLAAAEATLSRRVLLGVQSVKLLGTLINRRAGSLARLLGRDVVTAGHGPWGCESLDEVLGSTRLTAHFLDEAAHEIPVFVVGREGVDIRLLRAQLDLRFQRQDKFWLFSQELFLLSLIAGDDLLLGPDASPPLLVSEFAQDHPVLAQFIDAEDWAWPLPTHKPGEAPIELEAGASPLGRVGYQVGRKGLPVDKRRALLTHFWSIRDLEPYFLVEHDADYRKRWGSAGSGRRLTRMVQHIRWLHATQGQLPRNQLAKQHWAEDLKWIRSTLAPRAPATWLWPNR